jgi:hypothetical protein
LKLKPSLMIVVAITVLTLGAFRAVESAPSGKIGVEVDIDYGPAEKPPVRQKVLINPGSTVVEATRIAVSVKQGVVCCNAQDVQAIGGVGCGKKAGCFWLYSVNGKKGPIPAFQFHLREGDRVSWRYRVVAGLKR